MHDSFIGNLIDSTAFDGMDGMHSGEHGHVPFDICMRVHTCPVCGKEFTCYPSVHVYRRYIRGAERMICSWSCMRKHDRESESRCDGRSQNKGKTGEHLSKNKRPTIKSTKERIQRCEETLAMYRAMAEEARADKDRDRRHLAMQNVSNWRKRLRDAREMLANLEAIEAVKAERNA